MSLVVVPGVPITEARLVSSSIIENDAPLWEANRLTNESAFDVTASWTTTTATVTANTDADPGGKIEGDTLTAGAANGQVAQAYTALAVPYTFSVWIRRKVGTGAVQISADGTTFVTVTLAANGAWQRFETTLTPTAGARSVVIRLAVSGDAVALWSAQLKTKAYTIGERVLRPNHNVYQRVTTGTSDTPPENDTVNWTFVSPSRRFAPFDSSNSTAATDTTTISFRVKQGQAINSVGLRGLVGNSVRIRLIDPVAGTVYDRTMSLAGVIPQASWYSWFFSTTTPKSEVSVFDIPPYTNADVLIDITPNNSGQAAVATFIVGAAQAYGTNAEYGARVGIRDYSIKITDSFGNTQLKQRAFSQRADFTIYVDAAETDALYKFLISIRSTPCLWQFTEAYEAATIFAYFADFDIPLVYPTVNMCNLTLEGLA